MLKYLLASSIALNVALAAFVIVGSNGLRDRPGALLGSAMDLNDLYQWARDGGLQDQAVGTLLLEQIRAQQPLSHADAPTFRSRSVRQAELVLEQLKFDQHARGVLTAEFGEKASSDPAFKRVFEPYAQSYPFLSPEKQVALQQLLLQDQVEQALATGAVGRSAGHPSVGAMSSIKALLTEEEFFEYQLRESELAERLSRGSFEFTDDEFRAVFRAHLGAGVIATGGSSGVPFPRSEAAVSRLSAELEEILGADRYRIFKRSRDPVYALLRNEAKKHGVDERVVDSAYVLIEDAERKAVQIKQDQERSTASKQRLLSDLYGERNRELRSVLGDGLFSELESVLAPVRSPLAVNRLPLNRQVAR